MGGNFFVQMLNYSVYDWLSGIASGFVLFVCYRYDGACTIQCNLSAGEEATSLNWDDLG